MKRREKKQQVERTENPSLNGFFNDRLDFFFYAVGSTALLNFFRTNVNRSFKSFNFSYPRSDNAKDGEPRLCEMLLIPGDLLKKFNDVNPGFLDWFGLSLSGKQSFLFDFRMFTRPAEMTLLNAQCPGPNIMMIHSENRNVVFHHYRKSDSGHQWVPFESSLELLKKIETKSGLYFEREMVKLQNAKEMDSFLQKSQSNVDEFVSEEDKEITISALNMRNTR